MNSPKCILICVISNVCHVQPRNDDAMEGGGKPTVGNGD